VDALKVKLPPAEPIADLHRPQFDSIKQAVTRKLDQVTFSTAVDLAGN
jgi:hypothetical protein